MDIPYLFVKAGCSIDIFCRRKSWLATANYHTTWHVAPDDPALYVKDLEKVLLSTTYDWIVAGDDIVIRLLGKRATSDVLQKNIALVLPEHYSILGSKANLSLFCSKHAIPTPPYALYLPGLDPHSLADTVAFPLLLKVDESAGGAGVFLCQNHEDVACIISSLTDFEKENLVFQKYIHGKNIAIESLYKDGRLIMYSYAVVTKTLNSEFGVSVERKYIECPKIEKRLRMVGEALGFNGFCSMTYIDDGKEHYLIEADMRPQAWYLLGKISGADFVRGIQEFFSDTPRYIPSVFPKAKKEVYVRHFLRELLWFEEQGKYRYMYKWLCNIDGRWRAIPWHSPRVALRLSMGALRYGTRVLIKKFSKI